MKILYYFIFLSMLSLMSSSCEENKKVPPINYNNIEEHLIESHKYNIQKENELILEYIKEKKWNDIIETSTGLRYWIYQDEEGQNAISEQIALIDYRVSLLNDTKCYDTEGDFLEIVIDYDDYPTGMHEGIKYMSVGDKAKMILPSRLAYGLTGDQNEIPMNSSIVIDIEMIALQ